MNELNRIKKNAGILNESIKEAKRKNKNKFSKGKNKIEFPNLKGVKKWSKMADKEGYYYGKAVSGPHQGWLFGWSPKEPGWVYFEEEDTSGLGVAGSGNDPIDDYLEDSDVTETVVTEATREDRMDQVESIITDAIEAFVEDIEPESQQEGLELINYFRKRMAIEISDDINQEWFWDEDHGNIDEARFKDEIEDYVPADQAKYDAYAALSNADKVKYAQDDLKRGRALRAARSASAKKGHETRRANRARK